MAQEDHKGIWDRIGEGFSRFGATPLFIIANGLVIAAITFVILSHETNDQKEIEARNQTRDIIHMMEQSISDVDKTQRALAAYYARQAVPERKESMQKFLTGGFVPESLLWATEKGVYHQENVSGGISREAYDPLSGWPGFQDLARETGGLGFNEVSYLGTLHWPAFRKQSAGLALKTRMDDGTTGILLVVTTPADIFGKSWTTQREDIARITIIDHASGDVIVDNMSPAMDKLKNTIFDAVPVNYALQLGGSFWDVKFQVVPTATTRFLTVSPWAALSAILLLTFFSALIADRKRQQDLRIAEMSQNLAGAHHELQTKTSERDQLFHALRKSEREYRAVINSVSDVIFETDETGRIVFLNETWKRVTDSETPEFIGRPLFDVFSAADRVKQREMFDGLVRGERQAYRTETYLDLGAGARPRAVEVAFSMLRMTDDKNLRVVGTITDIEKRRRAENAMREAEQRYRTIFENSVSGIHQTSPDGRFISANPALAEIFGYESTEELIYSVNDIAQQVYVRPEDRQAFVQKLLFEGRVSGVEAEVYRKDGTKIWIMENARVVRSPKGSILYYEGSVWDVTERKQAEETMRQARLQAEMSSRSRMEFLANMSHELRTPLNAVIGFSEIIKGEVMGPIGVPAYKEYAQDIYDSGNYLLKIISEILEVSKIETGNRELNQTNFRMTRALKSCMTIMSSRIEQSGVQVKVELPDELPEILAEELGFKQIMLNLIGNAIKFTPKDGKVSVTARVDENGEMLIDVTDTGIGMTEAEVKKALQPFGKVDNNFSTMKEGTGLGLTIVDSLVRLHGGRLELISQKGAGTTARIVLPPYRVLHLSNVTPIKASK